VYSTFPFVPENRKGDGDPVLSVNQVAMLAPSASGKIAGHPAGKEENCRSLPR
jgi:hypothetical protein